MTANDPPDGPPADVLLARAGFGDVVSALHARLAHDLNGRAASLLGVMELLRSAGVPGEPLDYLDEEVVRLEELARRLGALPRALDTEAEPLVLRDVAASVLHVAEGLRGFEDAPLDNGVDGDLPPVLAGRSRTMAALLVLVHRARTRRSPEDRHEALVLEGAAEDDRVAVWIAGDAGPDGPADADRLDALGALLAEDGAEVRVAPGGPPTVRIPTLRAARARERAGG